MWNKPRQWWALGAHEVNPILGHITKTVYRRGREIIIPFYSPLVSPNLNYCVHFSTRMTLLNWKEPSGSHQDNEMSQGLDSRPLISIYLPRVGYFTELYNQNPFTCWLKLHHDECKIHSANRKEKQTKRKLEPEIWFVIKSLPFGGDKPGILSPVPRQFMLFTEQIIHIIKCNLIKCSWKEKEIKSRSCS